MEALSPGHGLGPLRRLEVLSQESPAPGVKLLRLNHRPRFVPGQCVALGVDDETEPRYYSIASAPGEPLEVLYDLVPDGSLTPRLAGLAPGDGLYCSEPFGGFVDQGGSTCWIATGTGVAPFLSMARAALHSRAGAGLQGKRMIHGARGPDYLLGRRVFEAALGESYQPCCSRDEGTGCYPGRLTAYLRALPEPAALAERFLLCGSAAMVVEVRELLIERGVPFAAIGAEVYF